MEPIAAQTGHRLIIRHELRMIGTVELTGGPLVIGRSPQCGIRLPHEAVSRHHARLEYRDGAWQIIDAGSVNGIRVNGRRVAEAALRAGDVIEIRPFAMNYMVGAAGDLDQSISLSASCENPTMVRAARSSGQIIRQRLDDLYALARLIIHRKENGSFWQEMHAALQRSLSAERCVLVGVDDRAGVYRLAPRARASDADVPLVISRSVLNDVVAAGRSVLIRRVAEHDKYAGAESLITSRAGSVLCSPVVVSGKTRAVVYAERPDGRLPFQGDDLDFVTAAMDMAAAAVDVDELQERAKELSRVRGRIETAREMQEMLLPSPIPQPSWGQVAARNTPADQMSGDLYDALIDGRGRLVVSIADVSGKGVPAAFVTAILHNTFHQALSDLEDLGAIVRRINATLDGYRLPACYATMILCRWSQDGGRVEIANAGHHAALWGTAGGEIEAFPDRVGLPLGIMPEWNGEVVVREASRDVAMLICSDGATEAKNARGDDYSLARLGGEFLKLIAAEADAILAGLVERVREFCAPREPDDDVTMLVVKRRPREDA